MCLGIPARIVDVDGDHPDLAIAEVSGVPRQVNLGLVAGDGVEAGDWVVIHMGFVLEKITEEEAMDAMDVLETIGPGGDAQPPPWPEGGEEPPW